MATLTTTYTTRQFRAHLREAIEKAEDGRTIVVTDSGVPRVIVLGIGEWERLQGHRLIVCPAVPGNEQREQAHGRVHDSRTGFTG